jgi:Fusaric acid resistance protein-like
VRGEFGISWDWREAARGALGALPGAAIMLAVDTSLGMCFALGTLLVGMLGVPPERSRRPRLGLVGVAFAVAYGLGSVVGLSEVAAVAALTVLAYAGVLFSVRKPAARLLPALLLPGFALGMNHPAPGGFVPAAVMLAGGSWATFVTYCWPQSRPPAVASATPEREPDPTRARRAAHVYAILFAAAAGIGLALGYLLDLTHVAWAAAAAMFIMRPDPGLLTSRAVGRVIATFAGVIAAGLILRSGPTEVALAVVTVAAVSAMVAARTSRWYVAPAGSGLVVLLVSGVSGKDVFELSFVERLFETAIGAALALTFGVAAPAALRWLGRRRAATGPAFGAPP